MKWAGTHLYEAVCLIVYGRCCLQILNRHQIAIFVYSSIARGDRILEAKLIEGQVIEIMAGVWNTILRASNAHQLAVDKSFSLYKLQDYCLFSSRFKFDL